MEIRKTKMEDLETVLALYAKARQFMKENGNPTQWGDSYPAREMVAGDIEMGKGYVCEENGEILGVFYYAEEEDPTYGRIDDGAWLNDRPYGVMHRVASPSGRRGVATYCLNWCYEKSGQNLRIDTHRDNIPMQRMLAKNGFSRCGIVYMEDGSERIAYQKTGR